MTRETIAVALMVWLIGALIGWCAGWTARGEQNRGWHRGLVRQLGQVRAELADALDQLDDARAQLNNPHQRGESLPTSAVMHLHVAAPLGCVVPSKPLIVHSPRAVDAAPVVQAEEITR